MKEIPIGRPIKYGIFCCQCIGESILFEIIYERNDQMVAYPCKCRWKGVI